MTSSGCFSSAGCAVLRDTLQVVYYSSLVLLQRRSNNAVMPWLHMEAEEQNNL